jgi:hypothetical protein
MMCANKNYRSIFQIVRCLSGFCQDSRRLRVRNEDHAEYRQIVLALYQLIADPHSAASAGSPICYSKETGDQADVSLSNLMMEIRFVRHYIRRQTKPILFSRDLRLEDILSFDRRFVVTHWPSLNSFSMCNEGTRQ